MAAFEKCLCLLVRIISKMGNTLAEDLEIELKFKARACSYPTSESNYALTEVGFAKLIQNHLDPGLVR